MTDYIVYKQVLLSFRFQSEQRNTVSENICQKRRFVSETQFDFYRKTIQENQETFVNAEKVIIRIRLSRY